MLSSSFRLALYCTVQKRQNPNLYLEQQQQTLFLHLGLLLHYYINIRLIIIYIFISQFNLIIVFQRAV